LTAKRRFPAIGRAKAPRRFVASMMNGIR